jgi:transcription antitermination factor NusG
MQEQPLVRRAWYACSTRSRCERIVTRALESKAIETFLPMMTCVRRWSDRIKTLMIPAFPGYVFARTLTEDLWQLRSTVGLRHVLGDGRQATPVRDSEIANVRQLVEALSHTDVECQPERVQLSEDLAQVVGIRVKVLEGPLTGMEGFVVEARGRRRLLVVANSIGHGISIEIMESTVCRVTGSELSQVETGVGRVKRRAVHAG